MPTLFILIVSIFGLSIGSFIAALTYRLPRGISINQGRSFCDNCKYQLTWFDNIPLLSYLMLKGKCRKCGKKISSRYFLIELSTAFLFTTVAFQGLTFKGGLISALIERLGFAAIPYLLIIISILVAIFIIDLEYQLIFDDFVFFALILILPATLLFMPDALYVKLLSGFAAASFLLILHLITKGRGMGLGDVKLALFSGLFFGFPLTIVWLFFGFILGALVGIVLLALGKAKLGRPIPFGPFLAASFIITLLAGYRLSAIVFPFW